VSEELQERHARNGTSVHDESSTAQPQVAPDHTSLDTQQCHSCSYDNDEDTVTCVACSNALKPEVNSQSSIHKKLHQALHSVRPDNQSLDTQQCSACSYDNDEDAIVCSGCSHSLKSDIETDFPTNNQPSTSLSLLEVDDQSSNKNSCPVCSCENDGESIVCIACSNVLKPDVMLNHWRCRSAACQGGLYINIGDYGRCQVCGQAKLG
jgi:hypothetical protein